MKVFLGGTVADSTWRNDMIPLLEVDYFNPVVEEWTEEDQKREIYEREHCDFCLYVLTPKMIGWYSLAEVVDDSYKKNDKTIFCYLPTDGDKEFSKKQIEELDKIGKLVRANGGIWKQNIEEVLSFLNSANSLSNDELLQQTEQINSAFISYGRRHSLAFARKLHKNLSDRGYNIWFDMNDIPLGVDFQEQIDQGIRKADNFIYVMSPHSINSVYCYKELVLALKYNKRIIPILHVEPQDNATWKKIDPEAGKRNWIYMRQDHNTALELSAQTFDLQEKILEIPAKEWNHTDDFNNAFESLVSLLDSHREYVRAHTILLDKALDWLKNSRSTQSLLVGKQRHEAERFMERSHQVFKNATGHLILPPCTPTDLMAEFIMECKKNSANMQSDLFICHDVADSEKINKISSALSKHGFSSWISTRDISKGVKYDNAIHSGVVQSANMLLFVSKASLNSDYCKKEYAFAKKYNKRIIPVLIEPSPEGYKNPEGFEGLPLLQYINFTDFTNEIAVEVHGHKDVKADVEARKEKTPFEISVDEIVSSLSYEKSYFEEHRIYLVQALQWKEQGQKQSFLLRGYNLENAKTWLRLYKDKKQYAPLSVHEEFIMASEAVKGQLGTEVFISYSRKDGDFARKLNQSLQSAGKTTWFDQESISKGVDFEKEIFKGINGCDNFVFVISPDAVISEYCEREVDYAVSQNKRIITILARKTETDTLPEGLKTINWIDFKDTDFSEAFSSLIQAIELDREHASVHTKLQQRANEWKEQQESLDFLMNTTACTSAETWLSEAFGTNINTVYEKGEKLESAKTPKPTAIQIKYAHESRKAINLGIKKERQRQRKIITIIGSVAAVALIALFVSIYFYYDSQKATVAALKAKETALAEKKNADKERKKAEDALSKFLKAQKAKQEEEIRAILQRVVNFETFGVSKEAENELLKAYKIDSTHVEVLQKMKELGVEKPKND